jgi:hypothetical protein
MKIRHACCVALAAFVCTRTDAQIAPTYSSFFTDKTINESLFLSGGGHRWLVPAGADSYSAGQYERPTSQAYRYFGDRFATDGMYFANLDLKGGAFGYDQKYLYVRINLVGTHSQDKSGTVKNEGLIWDYRFRINTDASGAYGYLFAVDQPSSQGTTFRLTKNSGYHDKNGDADRKGNGYEVLLIGDGKMKSNGASVFFSRISPADSSSVEFALDYTAVGLNPAAMSSITMEAVKGLRGTSNYPWNKHYTASEAGSPNGGPNGLSEFGTSGLGNIYEVDTLTGVPGGGGSGQSANLTPPTGKLIIPRNLEIRGSVIPIGFSIVR